MKMKMSKEDKAREEKWAIESAMSTISRYNEIQKDKALLSKVKRAAAEQVKMLGGMVSGIGTAPAKKVIKKK
jgi:hypothetical protein